MDRLQEKLILKQLGTLIYILGKKLFIENKQILPYLGNTPVGLVAKGCSKSQHYMGTRVEK